MRFFDYEIHQDLVNADYLDKHGFFVGNSQVNLKEELNLLLSTVCAL